jgi:uncharacterized membrane protein
VSIGSGLAGIQDPRGTAHASALPLPDSRGAMQKIKAVWANIQDSLWFFPALLSLGSVVAAVLVVRFDDALAELTGLDPNDFWWLFGGGSEAARTILDVIAGSIITVTGVTFSVVIVALQLTSSQFTPRVLRTFTADRGNQLVLGVFIATFAYTLMVQRAIRSSNDEQEAVVPAFAISLAIVLVLVSLGFLIYFIDHTTRSIQASVIIDNVTRDTRRGLERLFESEDALRRDQDDGRRGARRVPASEAVVALYEGAGEDDPDRTGRRGDCLRIGLDASGYVQAVDEEGLFELADEHDLYLEIESGIGDFVLPGESVLSVWPADRVGDDLSAALRRAYHLGLERTPHQDVELGMIELVDIAVKAMSPSVNDPTTAISALDRISELLVLLGRRTALECERRNGEGRPCLLARRPTFARSVTLTFDQIRHHSADNPAVMSKMLDRLGDIGVLSRSEHRPRVLKAIDVALRHAAREIAEPADLATVERAAAKAKRRIEHARDV